VPTPVHATMVGVKARETILAVKARDDIVGMEGSLLSFRSRPQVRPTSTKRSGRHRVLNGVETWRLRLLKHPVSETTSTFSSKLILYLAGLPLAKCFD
jgi:hypothetical protein